MTAVAGSSERSTFDNLPSRTGPTTTKSRAGACCSCHKSLVKTVTTGAWRSACQQAVNSRANSVSSVSMTTLACRKGNPLQNIFPLLQNQIATANPNQLQLVGFVQRRKQPLRADAEIYCCFRIFRLLRHIHALL